MNSDSEIVHQEHDYELSSDIGDDLKKKRPKASTKQLEFLLDYMKKHPEMWRSPTAHNSQSRRDYEKSWVTLVNILNRQPGIRKSGAQWKQAWRGMKHNLKKKESNGHITKCVDTCEKPLERNEPSTSTQDEGTPETVNISSLEGIETIRIIFADDLTATAEEIEPTPLMTSSPDPGPQACLSADPDSPEAMAPIEPMLPTEPVSYKVKKLVVPVKHLKPVSSNVEKPAVKKGRMLKKERIVKRLGSLLDIEHEKIKIEKERNAILAQKSDIEANKLASIVSCNDQINTILTERNIIESQKAAALDRLTNVLQDILAHMIKK